MTAPDTAYLDPTRTFQERARDLVARMTLEEKVAQMQHDAPAIERLGVSAHNWWNECLHGVGRAGIATVFPQAIGLAATWDLDLVERVATATSDEARAKHHEAARHGDRGQYKGLTFWSPVVNLFRDPRWGRGQETYGEDPHLTGSLAVAFLRGLQGRHPRYLKLAATLKHFAAYSGPDHRRHEFDAQVTERELRQTYLPHFETGVREGGATCVMTAYNRLNGEPCSSHDWLIGRVLREEWGFDGYVVSDCDAINDVFGGHQTVGTPAEAAARAVRAGCDLECGCTFVHLVEAVEQGLLSEPEIDRAVERLFVVRFRLGMFDPPDDVAYANIPISVVDSEAHRAVAREAARKSVVLLKNEGRVLPFASAVRRVVVVGPHADSLDVLLGNYNGMPSRYSTLLSGLREVAPSTVEVRYARGCDAWGDATHDIPEAVELAKTVDVVVLALGMSPKLEGEQGEVAPEIGTGDRTTLDLPPGQRALFDAIAAVGKPVVVVLTGGGPLAGAWASRADAILMAWYPGEEGGNAVADVLFGKYNPAGRLPVTFYQSSESLPSFDDYRMEGRTYRFLREPCLFPFGHGLSYTSFRYSNVHVAPLHKDNAARVNVRVDVENVGSCDGDEVVQLYVTDEQASQPVPIRTLAGFQRLTLRKGERITVHFTVEARQLAVLDESGQPFHEPGTFILAVGGGQPNAAHAYESDAQGLITRFASE